MTEVLVVADDDEALEITEVLVDDEGNLEAHEVGAVVGNQPPLGNNVNGGILWQNLKVKIVDDRLPSLGGAVAGGEGVAGGVGAPVERQLDDPVDGGQLAGKARGH